MKANYRHFHHKSTPGVMGVTGRSKDDLLPDRNVEFVWRRILSWFPTCCSASFSCVWFLMYPRRTYSRPPSTTSPLVSPLAQNAMSDQNFIHQHNIFDDEPSSIHVAVHHAHSLGSRAVRDFLATVQNGFVGVAPAYGSHCALSALAFASATHVLIVNFSTKQRKQTRQRRPTTPTLIADILSNPGFSRYSLHADCVATALHLDLELQVGDVTDLWSLLDTADHASDHSFIKAVCGEIDHRTKSAYKNEKQEDGRPWRVALRAWLSGRIAFRTDRETLTGLCRRVDVGLFDLQV